MNTLVVMSCPFTAFYTKKNLCKASLDLNHVIDPIIHVVNLIKGRALNHRQFKYLLEDMEAVHTDIMYHNNVRWLSLGKVLQRIWELQDEILLFLDIGGISCYFVTKMRCEN